MLHKFAHTCVFIQKLYVKSANIIIQNNKLKCQSRKFYKHSVLKSQFTQTTEAKNEFLLEKLNIKYIFVSLSLESIFKLI